MITYSKKDVNKSASDFYVVCADGSHTGGWCSSSFTTFDDVDDALNEHRRNTGHTDNSVENNCPFGSGS